VRSITHDLAFGLAAILPVTAAAVECDVEIQPPVLEPAARDGHRDRTIYGWQLMTHEERSAFLARVQAAPTPAERDALRQRNNEAMVARARARGVVLPAAPGASAADRDRHAKPLHTHACADSGR
jgi:hypothetical protein